MKKKTTTIAENKITIRFALWNCKIIAKKSQEKAMKIVFFYTVFI